MNTTNILAVADAIEQHTIEDLGFNMALWAGEPEDYPAAIDKSGHNCGTVACIGGTADALRLKTTDPEVLLSANVSDTEKWLGIDSKTAASLFFMDGEGPTALAKVSASQAVRTLRHLAATGNVDWTV